MTDRTRMRPAAGCDRRDTDGQACRRCVPHRAPQFNVITTQTIALANAVTAVQILGRRLTATVLLIEALGGSWNANELPSTMAVTERTTAR